MPSQAIPNRSTHEFDNTVFYDWITGHFHRILASYKAYPTYS